MLAQNWLLRAEYRYAGFGTWNVQSNLVDGATVTNLGYQVKISTQIATLGIAYKFAP